MNPLIALKNMLNSSQRVTTGIVISNDAEGLKVSTSEGIKLTTQTDATQYKAGNKVQLQGQIVTGKVASEDGIQVYTV